MVCRYIHRRIQSALGFGNRLVSWVFDQLLGLVVSALSAIDLGGLNNYNPQTGFTSEMLNIMGLIGLGEASAIIVTAIGIRLILQLIPFTRLGS